MPTTANTKQWVTPYQKCTSRPGGCMKLQESADSRTGGEARRNIPVRRGRCRPVFMRRRLSATSHREPLNATEFHNLQAIACAHLAKHVVNVVAHRLLGKVQLHCNLLVGEPAADQKN